MKKRMIILAATLCLTLICVIASMVTTVAAKSKDPEMLLKQYENHLALYRGNEIIQIYHEIDVRLLTEYDRYLLRKGIIIQDDSQLQTILEDYDA